MSLNKRNLSAPLNKLWLTCLLKEQIHVTSRAFVLLSGLCKCRASPVAPSDEGEGTPYIPFQPSCAPSPSILTTCAFPVSKILQHLFLVLRFPLRNVTSCTHPCSRGWQLGALFYCYVVFCCGKIPSVYLAFLHFIWTVPMLVITHKSCCEHFCSCLFVGITHFTFMWVFKQFLLK